VSGAGAQSGDAGVAAAATGDVTMAGRASPFEELAIVGYQTAITSGTGV
jgi:hypothetical protein